MPGACDRHETTGPVYPAEGKQDLPQCLSRHNQTCASQCAYLHHNYRVCVFACVQTL